MEERKAIDIDRLELRRQKGCRLEGGRQELRLIRIRSEERDTL
jgi:hypothetical protein